MLNACNSSIKLDTYIYDFIAELQIVIKTGSLKH